MIHRGDDFHHAEVMATIPTFWVIAVLLHLNLLVLRVLPLPADDGS